MTVWQQSMIKRHKEGQRLHVLPLYDRSDTADRAWQNVCPAAVQELSIWQLPRGVISIRAISLSETKSSCSATWIRASSNTDSPRRVQAAAMSMRRKNVGIALPDFTAAAAVRPIPTISTAPSRMRMISGVSCRKSVVECAIMIKAALADGSDE